MERRWRQWKGETRKVSSVVRLEGTRSCAKRRVGLIYSLLSHELPLLPAGKSRKGSKNLPRPFPSVRISLAPELSQTYCHTRVPPSTPPTNRFQSPFPSVPSLNSLEPPSTAMQVSHHSASASLLVGSGGFYGMDPNNAFEQMRVHYAKKLKPFVDTGIPMDKFTKGRKRRKGGCCVVQECSSLVEGRGFRAAVDARAETHTPVTYSSTSLIVSHPLSSSASSAVRTTEDKRMEKSLRRLSIEGGRDVDKLGKMEDEGLDAAAELRRTTTNVRVARARGHAIIHKNSHEKQHNVRRMKFPMLLACDFKELPNLSPAQTQDVNISGGLRDYHSGEVREAARFSCTRGDHGRHERASAPKFKPLAHHPLAAQNGCEEALPCRRAGRAEPAPPLRPRPVLLQAQEVRPRDPRLRPMLQVG